MNYEKEYKSLVVRVKKAYLFAQTDSTKKVLEDILPALRESEDDRIRKEIITLYSEIETCISELLNARTDKDSEAEGKALFKMEGLMVATLQDLSCVKDYLEKQKEKIPYIDFVIKPHKGDDNNPYDMRVSEAQEYAIKRGFGIPFNDGEVYVDERHLTQTIGNILRWADEHPKEQKPSCWNSPIMTHEMIIEKPNDLEEAAERYGKEYCCEWWGGHSYVDDSEVLTLAFKAGAEWDREQMMKEAVEGTYAVTTVGHFAFFPDKPIKDLCFGDKVRIVIVKEEKNGTE